MCPESAEERCWNHKLLNVLDQLPRRVYPQALALLRQLPYAPTPAACERLQRQFAAHYRRAYPKAGAALEWDWDWVVTFYRFPREHWKHLRTTNVVDPRSRWSGSGRTRPRATALIWKALMVAQGRSWRLDACRLLADISQDVSYPDGVRVAATAGRVAA